MAHARFRLDPLALALVFAGVLVTPAGMSAANAQALPGGLNVVHGQAAVATQGGRMTVTSTQNAILNWQSFSIGAGNSVRFDQPNASSQVLNRVLGNNPSSIFGQLSSNGRVWLLNPNGVLFGPTARVDVAGLVASTLNISDADWQAQRYSLLSRDLLYGPTATVINQGELRSTMGGRVMLIGGAGGVSNQGLIEAPGGQVVLAAGHSVDLGDSTLPDMAVRVTAPQGQVLNLGRITAAGGRVDLQGAMINQSGIVRADALVGSQAGEIVLRASDSTLVSGQIGATSDDGHGGRVLLLGPQVGVLDGATVDVSGRSGGGQILVGGGLQGRDAAIPNSRAVYFGSGASLRADATESGPGGTIILWSDQATRAYGRLSARGGALGGDGGFIETSGGWLDARPASVRTDAARGRSGQWLLDPNDITITDSGSETNVTAGPNFTTTDDSAVIPASSIVSALNAGNNVTITTASNGQNTQAGDITVSVSDFSVAPSSAVSLTLNAARNIDVVHTSLSSSGAPLGVTLNGGTAGAGGIKITSSSLSTAGGSITLGGPSVACGAAGCAPFAGAIGYDAAGRRDGVAIAGSTLDAGSGAIQMRGATAVDAGSRNGVSIDSSSSLSARDISIRGWAGTSGSGSQFGLTSDGQLLATHSMRLEGTSAVGGSPGSENTMVGVYLGSGGSAKVLPSGQDHTASLTIVGRSDVHPGNWDDSVVNDGVLRVAGSAALDVQGFGGDMRFESGLVDAAAGSSLSFSGSAFLLTSVDIQVPDGGTFTVSTDKGVYFQAGDVTGNPSSVLFNSPGGDVEVGGEFGSAFLDFGSAPLTIKAANFEVGSGSGSGSIYAGRILVQAQSILLDNGTGAIEASGTGNAITFAGLNGNATTFRNLSFSEGSVLSAPNGRWLVYATSPLDGDNFDPGNLQHDFVQYNAVYGVNPPIGTGNGLLFSLAPVLTVSSPVKGITKVYDGTTSVETPVDSKTLQLTGFLPGDSAAGPLDVTGLSYSDQNVADHIRIKVQFRNGLPEVIDRNERPVYGYGVSSSIFGDITPRPLTVVGLSAADKVYDGTRTASLSATSFSGLVSEETLTLVPGTGLFDTKDAGTGKQVTATLVLADGAHGGRADNYMLSGGPAVVTEGTITPRPVTATGIVASAKVYDGTTAAAVSGGSVSGTVAGESLTLALGPGQFDTKDAGTHKPVTAPATLVDGSGLASNYTLSDLPATGFGDITPRTVAVTGVTAANKEYDGTRTATLAGGAFSGLVGSETLTLAKTGLFDTKDVGTGKTVTATLALADGDNGGLASNYQLADAGLVTTTADISARLLTVSGLSAVPRAYDGTRSVTLAGTGSLSGLVGSETLGFTLGSGLFDTKDVGVDKTITATLLLSDGSNGGQVGNYRLAGGGTTTFTGTITPRTLTMVGITASDKVYDGNRSAAVSIGSVQGLVGSETLLVTPSGLFGDANAGAAKPVAVSLTLQDGTGGGLASNYAVGNGALATSASILQRPVTVSGLAAQNKVYDGGTGATLAGGVVNGLVAGETLAISSQAQFNDKNIGTAKPVSGSFALVDGTGGGQASNYVLSTPAAFTGSAAIQPRPLSVSGAAASDKVYDSTTTAAIGNWSLAGVLAGEQVSVAAGTGTFADPNVGAGKPVTATATTLGGADAGNYVLGTASFGTTASITPALLTFNATPTVRPVGSAIGSLPGTVSGFVGAESLLTATTGTLSFTSPASALSPEGVYPVTGGGLAATNYVFRQAVGNATALTLLDVPPTLVDDVTGQVQLAMNGAQGMLPLPVVSSPTANRSADALQTLVAGSTQGASFRSLDLANLTLDETAGLLSARDRYKRAIFADALAELERNPSLADLPACQTVEQAAAGNCLMTESLKPALRERIIRQQQAAEPVVAARPPEAAAPASPPAPVAAAPAPVQAPVVASARPTPAEPRLDLPARRSVRSAAVPQIQRKLALVIGIDNYADGRIPKLDNAASDAVAVGQVLENSLGYQTIVVRDGSKQTIIAAFNLLAAQVSPNDSVVIYYAGHGELLEKTGLGYWQPANADASKAETWISNSDIGKLLGQLGASQVALISDSCFSGSLVSDERIRGVAQTGDPTALLKGRAAVVMSSGGNEPVFDSGKNGHSTFAWNLMRTVEKVSTWRPGSTVFEQVRFAVARELPQRPQYGASRLGGHQTGTDYLFEQRQLDNATR